MRALLLFLCLLMPLALAACGSDEKTVVVPPGGTAVIDEEGDAKMCPPGRTC